MNTALVLFALGPGQIVLILLVVLLLFGGKKLPQLGSALGQAMTNFKKGLSDGQKEIEDEKKKSDVDSDNSKDA